MDELLSVITDEEDYISELIRDNIKDRRIVINEEISDILLEKVCLFIIKWNQEDKYLPADKRKPIYIYLSSDGGDCIMGTQILSAITTSITPVITIGFAKCASMASYILAAGHKRYCFENTVTLLHDGQTGYMSSGNKGKDIQKFYDRLDEKMQDFMVKHTKMTAEFLESIKDREYYIWSEEAKNLGIVDEIIGIDCSIEEII